MRPTRSLTLLLYIQIIISCAFVIVINRITAKHFITMDVYQSVEVEMQAGASVCAGLIDNRADFLACYRKINTPNASRYVSDAFLICGVKSLQRDDEANRQCNSVDPTQVKWLSPKTADSFFQRLMVTIDSRPEWVGLQLDHAPDGPRVLLHKSETASFLERLWGYRDNHLVYVLPFIVILCGVISTLAIRLMMVPIGSLEKSLLKLSAENFNPSDISYAKFKEFDGLTKIYQDLRIRLDESFRKARNFTSYASHELKTPLTILRGTAERLIAQLPVGSPAQVQTSQMGEEIERLIEITDKLLLLSRADAKALVAEREDFDFSGFLETLIEDAALFQEGLHIESDIAPGVVWKCDRVLVKQLVHNLYTNAVKYNVPGGNVRFVLQQSGDALTLTVSNTSVGVSTDVAEHAFDRFFRGDPSRSRSVDGLGLGLSICKEIATVHQGSLRFVLQDKNTVALTFTAPLRF